MHSDLLQKCPYPTRASGLEIVDAYGQAKRHVETTFSFGTIPAITGDGSLGDRLERIAFNTLPGAFTDDMWLRQ
jgi:hypothetical protein